MKKLLLCIVSLCWVGNALSLEQELKKLSTSLQRLIDDLAKHTVSPREPVISQSEKKQLINVLKDLDLEDEAGVVPEPQDLTVSEFTQDLKLAINEILKGFDPKTRVYIGYPNYSGAFLERHLNDFNTALKLLKAAMPHDSQIPDYEAWRPYLEKSVQNMPEKAHESQTR